MGNWFLKNGIAEKLRAALEDLRVGQGIPIAFRGLEDGSCLVKIVYNGASVSFVNLMPEDDPLISEVAKEAEIEVVDVSDMDITLEGTTKIMLDEAVLPIEDEPVEVVEEKPKKKRRRKRDVKSSES
jgi:BioD-like phosphotransacetylase family protein